jgi:hypothetical protein
VERAFNAFSTGEYVQVQEFSVKKGAGDMVDQYIITVQQCSDNRWEKILRKCGVLEQVEEKKVFRAASNSLANGRSTLYRSSPVKKAA